MNGYVDPEGDIVSGRLNVVGLCNKCYNKIVTKSVQELHNIQEGNQ